MVFSRGSESVSRALLIGLRIGQNGRLHFSQQGVDDRTGEERQNQIQGDRFAEGQTPGDELRLRADHKADDPGDPAGGIEARARTGPAAFVHQVFRAHRAADRPERRAEETKITGSFSATPVMASTSATAQPMPQETQGLTFGSVVLMEVAAMIEEKQQLGKAQRASRKATTLPGSRRDHGQKSHRIERHFALRQQRLARFGAVEAGHDQGGDPRGEEDGEVTPMKPPQKTSFLSRALVPNRIPPRRCGGEPDDVADHQEDDRRAAQRGFGDAARMGGRHQRRRVERPQTAEGLGEENDQGDGRNDRQPGGDHGHVLDAFERHHDAADAPHQHHDVEPRVSCGKLEHHVQRHGCAGDVNGHPAELEQAHQKTGQNQTALRTELEEPTM
jgi:hypothetical protein